MQWCQSTAPEELLNSHSVGLRSSSVASVQRRPRRRFLLKLRCLRLSHDLTSGQRTKVYVNSSTVETIVTGVRERESRLKNKSKLVTLLSFSVSRWESMLRQHTHTQASRWLGKICKRGCKIPLYRKLALPVNSPLTEIHWGFQGNRSTDLKLWAKPEMNSWFVGHNNSATRHNFTIINEIREKISVHWGVNIGCDGMCVWGFVVSSEAASDSQYDVLFSCTLKNKVFSAVSCTRFISRTNFGCNVFLFFLY